MQTKTKKLYSHREQIEFGSNDMISVVMHQSPNGPWYEVCWLTGMSTLEFPKMLYLNAVEYHKWLVEQAATRDGIANISVTDIWGHWQGERY